MEQLLKELKNWEEKPHTEEKTQPLPDKTNVAPNTEINRATIDNSQKVNSIEKLVEPFIIHLDKYKQIGIFPSNMPKEDVNTFFSNLNTDINNLGENFEYSTQKIIRRLGELFRYNKHYNYEDMDNDRKKYKEFKEAINAYIENRSNIEDFCNKLSIFWGRIEENRKNAVKARKSAQRRLNDNRSSSSSQQAFSSTTAPTETESNSKIGYINFDTGAVFEKNTVA